jgi:hypothetical protein
MKNSSVIFEILKKCVFEVFFRECGKAPQVLEES